MIELHLTVCTMVRHRRLNYQRCNLPGQVNLTLALHALLLPTLRT